MKFKFHVMDNTGIISSSKNRVPQQKEERKKFKGSKKGKEKRT